MYLQRSKVAGPLGAAGFFGQDFLVLLHFPRGILRAAGALVKLAELVVGGRMVRLEAHDVFKFADGFVEMAQSRLGQAELEMHGGHGVVNLLGLLKGLDGRLRLVQAQISAAHQVVGRRAVVIEVEGLLALCDHVRAVPGEQVAVGQIQPRVEIFRRQFYHLQVGGDGVGGVAFFQITVAARHQTRKASFTPGGPQQEDGQHHQAESEDDPNQTL